MIHRVHAMVASNSMIMSPRFHTTRDGCHAMTVTMNRYANLDARSRAAVAMTAVMLATVLVGCTPTVRLASDDPITINMNINIQHDIRVRVERELDELFDEEGVF